MHLSKIIRPGDEQFKRILEFEAKKVGGEIPEAAKTFLGEQPPPMIEPFKLDELISHQTGVYESEKARQEQKVDDKAIEKIREIQEKAYQEAYDLGLEEGRKRAYDTNQEDIKNKLNEIEVLSGSIKEMKKELFNNNESLIIDLIYHISEKVVFDHIDQNTDAIKNIIKEVVESLDVKENISVKLNEDDFKIMQDLATKAIPGMDFLQKIKFQPMPEIQKGGCIIETDHGLVDATIPERLDKLWTVLNAAKPKV